MNSEREQRKSVNSPGWKWIPTQGVYLWWDGGCYRSTARWDGSSWHIGPDPQPSPELQQTGLDSSSRPSATGSDQWPIAPPKRKRPGWNRDPEDPGQNRYWDGETWTQARVPRASITPASTESGARLTDESRRDVYWAKLSVLFGALGIPFFFLGLSIVAIICAAQSRTCSRNAGLAQQPLALVGLTLGCIGAVVFGFFVLSIDWDALR